MPPSTPDSKKSSKLSAGQHERLLEALLEVTKGGIYEHSIPLDETIYHSERWANILGYRLEELPSYDGILEWLFERIHPDDHKYINKAYLDFIEGRSPIYDVEIRIRHKNGQWIFVRDVSKALEHTPDGRVRRLVGMMFDLTEQKLAQETISQLHTRVEEGKFTLDALMEYIPEGITIAGAPDVNIFRVSRLARNCLAKLGKSWKTFKWINILRNGTFTIKMERS